MNLSKRMQPATRSSRQPLGGGSGDWRRRFLRFHVPLALASALVIVLWMSLPLFQAAGHQGPPTDGTTPPMDHGGGHQGSPQADSTTHPMDQSGDQTANLDGIQNRLLIGRFTTATGYVALGLLALTLLIGPANLLLRRRNPVSSYLRRDGLWVTNVQQTPT